jgi:hypothetical protein
MPDNLTEALFSLFTSSDRAEAIAGDLKEEREKHGSTWFWLHVVRVALTLCRNAATEAPLRVLALAATGCVIFITPAFLGMAAVRILPHGSDSVVSVIALLFFWWGGALWIGASLVAIAPRRGMAACAMLAVAGVALLIPFAEFDLLYGIVLATAAPLLLGGAITRRRMITSGRRPNPSPAAAV